MRVFAIVILVLALAAVLGVLGAGLVQMVKGGDPHRSNKLMQYRVVLQALALGLFALILFAIRS